MQPVQLELGGRPHRNRQLFSDHYLDAILAARPDWRMEEGEAARLMAALRAIYERYTPSANEAQTERVFVRPVLEALGHTFEVQPAIRTPDGVKRPDYIFYADEGARTANRGVAALRETDLGHAFAVGDAKYWDRPLDQALLWGTAPRSPATGGPVDAADPAGSVAPDGAAGGAAGALARGLRLGDAAHLGLGDEVAAALDLAQHAVALDELGKAADQRFAAFAFTDLDIGHRWVPHLPGAAEQASTAAAKLALVVAGARAGCSC